MGPTLWRLAIDSPVFQDVLLTAQNVRSQWSPTAFLLIVGNWPVVSGIPEHPGAQSMRIRRFGACLMLSVKRQRARKLNFEGRRC